MNKFKVVIDVVNEFGYDEHIEHTWNEESSRAALMKALGLIDRFILKAISVAPVNEVSYQEDLEHQFKQELAQLP